MAIILNSSKRLIVLSDYNQGTNVYCRFRLYLKLVSWDSTNMTIAAKVTYQHTDSDYYSYNQQRATVTLGGTKIDGTQFSVATNGNAFTPGYWGQTEKNCFVDCTQNSSDTNGWKNITVPRCTAISCHFVDQGYESGAGVYAQNTATVYFPNDIWINNNGTWRRGWTMVNINGTWKWATGVYINNNNTWRQAVNDTDT